MAEDILSQGSTSSVKNTYNKYLAKIPQRKLESDQDSKNSSLDIQKKVVSNKKNSEFVPNITKVVENIIETGKKLEAASNDIMCKKPIISRSSRKAIVNEFVPFNLLNDDYIVSAEADIQIKDIMFEDNSFDLPNNINKFESQWGCDTQLAELMDNADAYLNLVNSNEMTQAHEIDKKEKSNSEITLTKNTCLKIENNCKTTSSSIDKPDSLNFDNEDKIFSAIEEKAFDKNNIFKVPTLIRKRKCCNDDSQDISSSKFTESFVGFRTASNQKISISQKALGHVKDIFKDIDLDTDILNSKHFNISTANESVETKLLKNVSRKDNFSSFNTAGDKISTSSINLHLLSSVSDSNFNNTSSVTVNYTGDDICYKNQVSSNNQSIVNESTIFKTASEKPIEISKEYDVLKAKKKNHDIPIPNFPENVSNTQECLDVYNFDKEIHSNNSLKIISKFQNQTSNNILMDTESHTISKNRNESLQDGELAVLNETYVIDKKQLNEIQGKVFNLQSWESFFDRTFDSSNNSNKSLSKDVENKDTMNSDSDDESISSSPIIVSQRYKEKSVRQYKVCSDSVKKTEAECINLSPINHEIVQFKATNDNNCMNKEKLKSCHLKDHICSMKNNNHKIIGKEYIGFSTASNKPIEISETSLINAQKLFENTFESTDSKKHEHKGFFTENPLDLKSSTITENTKFSSTKDHTTGFETTYNKEIPVSPKLQFNDIENSNLTSSNIFKKNVYKHDSKILMKQISQNKFLPGFKTANNKEISISDKALKVAKNIFSDIENTSDSNSRLQENFSSEVNQNEHSGLDIMIKKEQKINESSHSLPKKIFPGFKTANNKEISIPEKALMAAKNIFSDVKNTSDSISKLQVKFSTEINVDKHPGSENLVRTEQNIDVSSHWTPKEYFPGFKTANNKKNSVSQKSLIAAKNIFNDVDYTNSSDSKQHEVFSGFKTANNNEISISDKALTTAKNIFSDIENTNLNASEMKLRENKTEIKVDTRSGLDILGKKPQNIYDSSPKKCFPGFKTANNKDITVSEKSLIAAKSIFCDVENTNMRDSNSKLHENISASNAVVNEHSRLGVLQMQEQNYDDIFHYLPNKCFIGFKTASNKEIPLSEKALMAAKNKLSDFENTHISDAKQHEVISSEAIVDKHSYLDILENQDQQVDCSSSQSKEKKCFKTANNKEKALISAKNVFSDIKNTNSSDSDLKLQEKFSTEIKVSKQSGLEILGIEQQNIYDSSSKKCLPGLKSANNKDITVAEKITDKLDIDNTNIRDSNSNKCFVGFKTASNKEITMSEKALMTAKNIFSDFDNTNLSDSKQHEVLSSEAIVDLHSHLDILEQQVDFSSSSHSKNYSGFKTANNKDISISEKALTTAKNIFSDIENTNFNASELKLREKFSTEIKIDTQSGLEILGKEQQNIYDFSHFSQKKSFPGFKTANNEDISISEIALKATKNIFSDIENTNLVDSNPKLYENYSTGKNCDLEISEKQEQNITESSRILSKKYSALKTANNDKIFRIEDCLLKTKNLFDDITNTSENEIKLEEITYGISVSSKTFKGFSTANSKIIPTSETALKKARALFQSVEKQSNNKESLPTDCNATSLQFPDSNSQITNIGKNKNVQNRDVDFIESKCTSYSKNILDIQGKKSPLNKFNGDFSVQKNNPDIKDNCIAINEESLLKLDHSESVNTRKTNKSSFDVDTDYCFILSDNKQVIPSLQSLATEHVENFDTIHEHIDKKIEIRKNSCKRKRNSQILENHQESTKDDRELTFPHIGLTQEISESTMALLTDEKKTNEKVSEDDNIFESPSSPIIQTKVKCSKTFRIPYKNKSSKNYVSTDKVDPECQIFKKRKIENCDLDSYKPKDINLGNLLFSKTNRGVNKMSIFSLRQFCKPGFISISEDIMNVTPENFEKFIFTDERIDIDIDKNIKTVHINQISQYFLGHKDIDNKLIPDGWVLNHVKWIMWKLASYERFLKYQCEKILTVGNVLKQLKYRYDRELYKAERPIIRKILECDDTPSRRMVICVSRIIKLSEKEGESFKLQCYESKYEIEVTDGWYCVIASIDGLLSQAIMTGKIVCGCKIVTCGAELLNCTDGKSPLEDISSVRLRLHGNSTRIAPPDAKLGLCRDCGPLRIKAESLKARSGSVPVLRIAPFIMYPQLYVEKLANGDTITRSEKLEQVHSSSLDMDFQAKIEKIYSQVEKEVSDNEMLEKNKKKMHIVRGRLQRSLEGKSGEELMDMLHEANDPVDFMNSLSGSQKRYLENAVLEKQIYKRGIIDNHVKDILNEQGLGVNKRKVVSILKVRGVALEITKEGKCNTTPVMLTIWKVDDNILHILQHSQLLDVFRAIPTGFRMGELHLSTCKQTIFNELTNTSFLDKFSNLDRYKRRCTPIKELNYSGFAPMFNEADTVGLVFHIEPSTMRQTNLPNSKDNLHLSPNMQTAYLTDDQMNFLAIHFWGGIFKFGYEKIIENGKILACSNLQHRPRTSRKRFRNLYATEYSTFTQCPRKKYMEQNMKKLEELFKAVNVKLYMENCKKKLIEIKSTPWIYNNNRNCNSFIQNNSNNLSGVLNNRSLQNIQPVSVSNANVSNQSSNEVDENSLSGLDFESTFNESSIQRFNNSTPKSSKFTVNFQNDQSTLQRSPSDAEKRIKRLKMYGEPPPISPIVLNVSKNLKKDFLLPRLDLSSTSLNNISASSDCSKHDGAVLSEYKRSNKN